MTTTVIADSRSRVVLRGAEDGCAYTVQDQPDGWIVRRKARVRQRGLSGKEFAKLWQARESLDAETAADVAANIKKTREASRARAS
jgi:hypothetical protein